MKRYLPEALFFASAAFVLGVLRLDAFGGVSEFLVVILLIFLGVYHGAIPAALIVAALALKFKDRGAAAVAPVLGGAFAISAFFLIFTGNALDMLPRIPEFYWGALGIVPIVAIAFFIVARIHAVEKTLPVYLGGALLLGACYFATPWASDLVLALMKGPSLQAELINSRGHQAFATYDYSYSLFDEVRYLLVYDPADTRTNAVLARFKESDRCGLHGFRIISSYYVVRYVYVQRQNFCAAGRGR